MKKKEILDEILAQLSDLKRDIRDLKSEILKISEKENSIKFVDSNLKTFSFQRFENNICPSCKLDLSKGNVCCMSTNCPYRTNVTCSTEGAS